MNKTAEFMWESINNYYQSVQKDYPDLKIDDTQKTNFVNSFKDKYNNILKNYMSTKDTD